MKEDYILNNTYNQFYRVAIPKVLESEYNKYGELLSFLPEQSSNYAWKDSRNIAGNILNDLENKILSDSDKKGYGRKDSTTFLGTLCNKVNKLYTNNYGFNNIESKISKTEQTYYNINRALNDRIIYLRIYSILENDSTNLEKQWNTFDKTKYKEYLGETHWVEVLVECNESAKNSYCYGYDSKAKTLQDNKDNIMKLTTENFIKKSLEMNDNATIVGYSPSRIKVQKTVEELFEIELHKYFIEIDTAMERPLANNIIIT